MSEADSAEPGNEEVTSDVSPEAAARELVDDEALLKTIDELDYSKYEKPELRKSIESMLSVVATLKFFLGVLLFTFPTCFSLIVWLFSDRGWLTIVTAVLGSALASFVIALLLAVTLATRRILNETIKVIDVTLEIVADVIQDVGTTKERGVVATVALVFGGVSRNLVLPIVESVVSSQLGCVGWPIVWLYRRTFAKAVDYTTNRLLFAAHKVTAPVTKHAAGTTEKLGDQLQSGAELVEWLFTNVRPYVVTGSRSVTWVILLPLWIVFFLTITGFGVVIGAALWLT